MLDGSGMFAAGVSYYSGIFTGSLSPSSQPTSSPTMPTSQPTSLPTSKPSMQPSAMPSAFPSSSPTSAPTLNSMAIVYANTNSSVSSSGYLISTTTIHQVGTSDRLYLAVKFLQTGFSPESFTVTVLVNNHPVCQACSVDAVCGDNYVDCCLNEDITFAVSNSLGGSLTITAHSNVPIDVHNSLCDGERPNFQVAYIVSKSNPLPTARPTSAPFVGSSSGNSVVALIEAVFVPTSVTLFLSGMVIFGIVIYYGRKDEPKVQQIPLLRTIVSFVMFGGTFLSQIFSAIVLFNSRYDPRFGYAWVTFRLIFVFVGLTMTLWLFTGSNKHYLNRVFLTQNKKLYGMVVMFVAFNPNLLPMLPWYQSPLTEVTMGFPSFFLCYLSTTLSVVETLILTIINAGFAINQKQLFEQSAIEQFEFCFSLTFTFVNGFVALVECWFLGYAKDDITLRETEILEMMTIRNPVQKDVEASNDPSKDMTSIAENTPDIRHLLSTMKLLEKAKIRTDERVQLLEDEKVHMEERFQTFDSRLKALEQHDI